MKVSKKKVTFQKTDRVLFDGTFITNGHVIWEPRRVQKEISFPDPAIFTKFAQGESFDWHNGEFSELSLDLAKVFAHTEKPDLIPAQATIFRADYPGDPVAHRIVVADGEILPVNQVYLDLFDNLETYKVPGQGLIAIYDSAGAVGGVMSAHWPQTAAAFQEIAKENAQYQARHEGED